MATWLSNLSNRSTAIRLMVLTTAVIAEFAIAAPLSVRLGGVTALAAATMAAGLCLAGAAAALVISDRLRGPNGTLAALWLTMTLRMGVPFLAGTIIHCHGGPLARAGLLWYLLVFYPLTLVIGTILSLPQTNQQRKPASQLS
jgi:hypothetical protein